jgi:hypothetical protein
VCMVPLCCGCEGVRYCCDSALSNFQETFSEYPTLRPACSPSFQILRHVISTLSLNHTSRSPRPHTL